MKAFKVITDPEAIQLLADETRRRIIYLLRAKEMTVSQIAAELNLTPQAIYHQIRKMRKADLVEVAREERVDHFIETYYRATAEVFHFYHGEGGSPEQAESYTREALEALKKVGIEVNADSESISRIVQLGQRMDQMGVRPELTDKIAELEDVDFLTKQGLVHYVKLLLMSDKEFEEHLKLQRDQRKLLQACYVEPKAARR